MQKGGYQIIDLENINHLNNDEVVHDGVYDKIDSTSKPILLSGIVYEGKKYHDAFVNFQGLDDAYLGEIKFPFLTLGIQVFNTDVIIFNKQ